MRYTELKEPAKVGTKKFVDGLTYVKQVNGKWLIDPTPSVRDWLTRLYVRKELTMRELSEETGIPHSSLQKLLNHFDLMRSKKEKARSHIELVLEEADHIRAWNLSMVSPGKIARRLAKKHSVDMCVWALKTACVRAKVPLHTKKKLRDLFLEKNLEKIQAQYEQGRSAMSLAKAINNKHPRLRITSTRIMEFLRRNGIPVRSQYEANLLVMEKNLAGGRTSDGILRNVVCKQSWHHKLTTDISQLTYREYRRLITTATRAAMLRFKKEYAHVIGAPAGQSIDHKFSVHDGYFKLNKTTLEYERRTVLVPVSIIAHPANLHLIPDRTNRMKGSSSWLTLKELTHTVKHSKFQLEREN